MAGLDPVEQEFIANTRPYVDGLLAATAAAAAFAQANDAAVRSVLALQAAISALHGKNIDIGVNTQILAASASAAADAAAAAAAIRTVAVGDTGLAATAAAATAATDRQRVSLAGTAVAAGGLALGLQVAHLGLAVFGAQIVADTAGIIAFGIAAFTAIRPVITSLSTLTTSYGQLDNYQKAAALSLMNLENMMGGHEAQVFTVFNQALGLVESHLQAAGGITSQASIAFMDFFSMLKSQFASTGWAALFSRSSSMVRTDLDALFGVINNLLGVVPGLFHGFNFLGLAALGIANDVLRATAAVLNFNPALTNAIALVGVGVSAYHLLSTRLITSLPTLSALLGNILPLSAAHFSGALKNLSQFGLVPTLGFMTGLDAAGLAAVSGIGLVLGGLAAYAIATRNTVTPVNALIAGLTAQAHATGLNAAGYQQLSNSLGHYTSVQSLANIGIVAGGHDNANLISSYMQLRMAQQGAAQTAQAINGNFAYLSRTFGFTRSQAIAAAQATGINLKDSLTEGGNAATVARSKMASYAQTMGAAAVVEKQFAYDMSLVNNTSLGMVQRLQGLSAAFQVLLGPLLQSMGATAQFKQAQGALSQAIQQDGTVVGVATQKQAALTLALRADTLAALAASSAILNNTHSAGAAAGPLIALRDHIRDAGLSGQAAAKLIQFLNQQIAALHSKTITITTVFRNVTVGSAQARFLSGHGGVVGGSGATPFQHGTPHMPPGLALVGEQGPELLYNPGPGGPGVLPAAATASLLSGRGSPVVNITLHVHGSVIAQQDLHKAMQRAVLDTITRRGATGFWPAVGRGPIR